jgi:cysteine-rich repeat protein
MNMPKKLHHLLWVLPILFVLSVPKALALTTETKLVPSDGVEESDTFGHSVSISGDYAVVGKPGDTGYTGSAYIFYKDPVLGWTQQKKLTASDGAAGDNFGYSVSISGTTVIVGAGGDDIGGNNNQGSAYIFSKDKGGADNWGQVTKITAGDGAESDSFGSFVSISGDYAVAGAPYHNASIGSAYIFYKDQDGPDNWGQIKELTASDGVAGDDFGQSVSISGTNVIVGAYRANSDQGAAYIFYKDQGGPGIWGQVKKLTASDAASGDEFSENSVSIQGSYAIVGASRNDSIYIFSKDEGGEDNWGQVKLFASDAGGGLYFGASISESGDYAVTGFAVANGHVDFSGAAYVFYNDPTNGWIQQSKLFASDGTAGAQFGASSSISGNQIIVGAPLDSVSGSYSGTAYIYDYTPPVCGDGVLSTGVGELCDDGNNDNGDGCDSMCQPEASPGCSFTFDELPFMSPTDLFCAGACHDFFGYPGGYLPDASHCFCVDQTVTECDATCVALTGLGVSNPICLFISGGGGGGCGDSGDGELCISGEVSGGVALTAGDDVTLTVDPANQSGGEDTDNTGVNTLTVWNNNIEGFNVTVALVGGDSGTTADTLGIASSTDVLNGTDGTIKFKSTENAGSGESSLAGGTDLDDFTAYTTGGTVYSNDNTTDGICEAGTITVGHELKANVEVIPGSYTGIATYTIASGV